MGVNEEGRVGIDPGLQPERTALAWQRSALALAGGSVVTLRLLPPVIGIPALVLGFAGVALALAVLIGSHRRYRRRRAALASPLPAMLSSGASVAALSAGVLILGMLSLVFVLFRG
ncbi:DUF202 domain-containing protein [Microbacterium soli]|uniref:DUF202 domain-containing protein n=1 Tax=Microbacterium soli TaxID=446075 RepID=A0ABP7MU02_9MICO